MMASWKKNIFKRLNLIVLPLTILFWSIAVNGEESTSDAPRILAEADALFEKGAYNKAGEKYTQAAPFLGEAKAKSAAYQRAVESYNKGELYYEEFKAIERLLDACPSQVDYPKYVEREYEIGESFYRGHRDPAYWALRFIPWMTSDDYTVEIYEKAVERAPFAKEAGYAKLQLAEKLLLKDERENREKGLKILRETIKDHRSDSKIHKLALLELGNSLYVLAASGDGDGKYNREATEVFNTFLKEYPNEQESFGIKEKILLLRDIRAKRLYNLAEFYRRSGRKDSAERYLNELVKIYPDTPQAAESEVILSNLDKSYIPEAVMPEVKQRTVKYRSYSLPADDEELLITPEESKGKWLLPIYSLKDKTPEAE
ncbi:MAG: outer membrane protein assembly factor BamD [Lentisphaeria bacterium]|nr:outer membrane protein assembly factor BamD [Lentisphaeria bacterium]